MVSSADMQWHLRSANRHLLAVPRFWLNTYGCRAGVLSLWPNSLKLSRILSGIQRAVQIVLGIYFKRTCSRVTSASSALGVLNDYALYKSTHSLTHMAMKYHLTFIYVLNMGVLPSVLSHCWLGGRKGIWPVKTEWWGAGMVICLELSADLHMAQLMPLPLTVSCYSKIQIGFTFLVPAHPGSPR